MGIKFLCPFYPQKIYIKYFFIEAEDTTNFGECHPFKENACCAADTVSSVRKLKESYGQAYHWDRCGKLSQACKFFNSF